MHSDSLILLYTFEKATLHKIKDKPILLVTATDRYIPVEDFKLLFKQVGETVKSEAIEKLIFDKRKLTVFHQPSMEWYFTSWKESMIQEGLTKHRKLLPNDQVFVESVKIGREQIYNKFPEGRFRELDIQYTDDIQKAIDL
ncbi:hypothetical protein [Fulvivirga ligni]|uniref:hypothetical protein n=1 Tax=Fulvivirga ligni TaxID=2904246 RepID=UPI001F38F097|nr:hypothetical protein [Fulvivirga ligni]UII22617.1 hypothetical protein LVD16_05180 [Fulvivirga ligni]